MQRAMNGSEVLEGKMSLYLWKDTQWFRYVQGCGKFQLRLFCWPDGVPTANKTYIPPRDDHLGVTERNLAKIGQKTRII